MTDERWERIKQAFWVAVQNGSDLDDGEFVDRHDALDMAERDELQTLLDEHDKLARVAAERSIEAPAPPLLHDRFEVLGHLGTGAFGDVYCVRDRMSGAVVALKVLRDAQSSALYYFKREFRSLADVQHCNIAVLHELLVHDGRWMFTMEFVDGTSIGRYLEECPHLERRPRLRDCFLQLAAGLNALHERQLLHRDLKPSNVMVARDGRVVILDFGLARPLSAAWDRAATLVGTPDYMSPEQVSESTLSPASDWYAYGVMLYEALTGTLPFSGSVLSVLQKKQHDAPPPPESIADVPHDLNDLCMCMLARDSGSRGGFTDALRVLASSAAPQERRSRELVGRERELAALRSAFDDVAGGRPVVAHISGSSGIGKSSLIREFIGRLQAEKTVLAFEGRCFESESVPYQGLDDLIDHLSQHLRRLDSSALQQILPRNFGVLRRMFPVLGQLPARDRAEHLPIDSYELRRLGFAALSELFGRLAERHHLILALDDLQWGDADGSAFFRDLLDGAGAPRLLLVLAYRTEALDANPGLRSLATFDGARGGAIAVRITLDRLDKAAAGRLARALGDVDAAMSQAAFDRVVELSDGEPFLVHEIMRWVNVRGGAGALAEPFSLADVIRTRAVDLDEDARHLLQLIAIAGQPIGRGILQAAFPFHSFAASRDRLLRERLIRSHLVQGRDVMETYHDRLRAVVVSLIDETDAVKLHRELAAAFERVDADDPERTALHFHAAGEPERATTYAMKAAARAMDAFAFSKAADLYQLALNGNVLKEAERRDAYRRLGDAWSNANKCADAAGAYLNAAAGAEEQDAVRLTASAASQLLRGGHIQRGIDMLETLVRQTGVTVMRNRLSRLCHVIWLRARIRLRGVGFVETPAAALSDEARMRLDVCWTGAVGTSMIEPIRSAEFSAQYVLLALKSGDPSRILLALAGESTQICHVPSGGDLRKAQALLDRAEGMAARDGDPYARAFILLMRGIVSFLHGEWTAAAALGDSALETLRSECTNVAWEQSTASTIAFNARALQGDWKTNRERLPTLMKDAEARGDLHASLSLRLIGGVHILDLANDEPERAREQLRRDLAAWPHEQYDLQKACGLAGEIDISLYLQQPLDAWTKLVAEWPLLRRSQLLVVPTMSVLMRVSRIRLALAVAASVDCATRERVRLLRVAERETAFVRRNCAGWSVGLTELARAGIASFGNDAGAVRVHLSNAERELLKADLTMFAAAASMRRAAYEAPDVAEGLLAQSRAWASARDVKRVDRVVACLAPGAYRDS